MARLSGRWNQKLCYATVHVDDNKNYTLKKKITAVITEDTDANPQSSEGKRQTVENFRPAARWNLYGLCSSTDLVKEQLPCGVGLEGKLQLRVHRGDANVDLHSKKTKKRKERESVTRDDFLLWINTERNLNLLCIFFK